MERYSKRGVTAVAGEVMDMDDIFSVGFGAPARVLQYIGQRGKNNQQRYCFQFETDDVTEVDVGFYLQMPTIQGMVGDLEIIASDHAYANVGDEGNLATAKSYLSGNGKDPRGETRRQGFDPATGKMVLVTIPPRPDGGYRANRTYYITVGWPNPNATGKYPPIPVVYLGSDDPEHGGERPIVMSDDPGDTKNRMFISGHWGVFVPDVEV